MYCFFFKMKGMINMHETTTKQLLEAVLEAMGEANSESNSEYARLFEDEGNYDE